MKRLFFLASSFVLIFSVTNLFAKDSEFLTRKNFYIGVDPSKNDKSIGNIDNSVSQDRIEEDRYYGYKFGERGFFVAPEVWIGKNNQTAQVSTSNQLSNPVVNYKLRANVGYDFNKYFSSFVTYDVARFSLDPHQGGVVINATSNLGAGNIPIFGIGSQVNFSNDFGVKFIYSQQQFQGASGGNAQVNSDVIKIGTVYNF